MHGSLTFRQARGTRQDVSSEEALRDIRGFASAGRLRIELHARQRMRERGASFADVKHALAGAQRCRLQENGRWRVDGEDLDGDELTAVVVLESGVVVVTVF